MPKISELSLDRVDTMIKECDALIAKNADLTNRTQDYLNQLKCFSGALYGARSELAQCRAELSDSE